MLFIVYNNERKRERQRQASKDTGNCQRYTQWNNSVTTQTDDTQCRCRKILTEADDKQ